MTKSELISQLAAKQPQLDYRDVELAVKELLAQMGAALAAGERIEVRGFGSFSLRYRPPRIGQYWIGRKRLTLSDSTAGAGNGIGGSQCRFCCGPRSVTVAADPRRSATCLQAVHTQR